MSLQEHLEFREALTAMGLTFHYEHDPLEDEAESSPDWPAVSAQLGGTSFEAEGVVLVCLDGSAAVSWKRLCIYIFIQPAEAGAEWEGRRLVADYHEQSAPPSAEDFVPERRWRCSSQEMLSGLRERLAAGYKPHILPNEVQTAYLLAASSGC